MGHVSSFFRMTQNLGGGRCAVWRLLDNPTRCLRPIYLDSPSTTFHYSPLRVRHGGDNIQNLRSLNRASTPVISPPPTRMALINAWSLVNKTFLLNYFFTTHALDFMFITETWIKVGDLSPFSDLVPAGCKFFLFAPLFWPRGWSIGN